MISTKWSTKMDEAKKDIGAVSLRLSESEAGYLEVLLKHMAQARAGNVAIEPRALHCLLYNGLLMLMLIGMFRLLGSIPDDPKQDHVNKQVALNSCEWNQSA